MDEMFDPKALLKTMGRPPKAAPAPKKKGASIDIEFETPATDPGPALEVRVEVTPRRPNGPVAALTAGGPVTEELRLLRAKLRTLDSERGLKSLGVVSAVVGEGKSTVALGLASVMAQEPGAKVLLLEADLRRPALEEALGLPRLPGLSEWLESGGSSIGLRRVLPAGFHLLPAGRTADGRHGELLGSERMTRLLAAARSAYTFVVVDCPPVMPVADAIILQERLDGMLFVVRERHSPRETTLRAIERLQAERVVGIVVNDHRAFMPGHYSYGGYRQPYR
ncbi:MAG: CpsD/CapB family tyrosine-protein kinase [Vicinamibacteria bacterium]